MSDLSPLKLVEDGQSSSGSQAIDDPSNARRRTDKIINRPDVSRYGTTQASRPRSPSEFSIESNELKYGAKSVIDLFIPISVCMFIVIATIKTTDQYKYSSQSPSFYGQLMFTDPNADTVTKLTDAILNALILLAMIVVMTTILIVLYKYRWYKLIRGWLITSSLMLLFSFTLAYVAVMLHTYNIPIDWITIVVGLWNFGAMGMICIHWKGPLVLQQAYLIMISALMALIFLKGLPDWTVWTTLLTVSIWDLVAVLSPKGPLRMLVETAQERNEPIFPALIYSSTILWEFTLTATNSIIPMADLQPSTNSSRQARDEDGPSDSRPDVAIIQPRRNSNDAKPSTKTRHQNRDRQTIDQNMPNRSNRPSSSNEPTTDEGILDQTTVDIVNNSNARTQEEERGVKLGLGDFIFYSLLVGKVSSLDDWTIAVSCYVAVLVGLSLTLSLLAVWRKALPALPISIALGLSFYFMSSAFVVPFASELTYNQIFI